MNWRWRHPFGAKCMYAAQPPRIYGVLVHIPFASNTKGALSPLKHPSLGHQLIVFRSFTGTGLHLFGDDAFHCFIFNCHFCFTRCISNIILDYEHSNFQIIQCFTIFKSHDSVRNNNMVGNLLPIWLDWSCIYNH